jgi:integrating conjugative element protein (TIGR03759 family)
MTRHWLRVGLWWVLSAAAPLHAIERAATQVIETDIGAAAIPDTTLSASDLARAEVWGLSATEWQRYQQLMQGIRGSVSPATLSPLEVLGIHARDADERQHFAEAWARALHEDTARILAFQQAYDDAIRRLYPNEPLIDTARLPAKRDTPGGFQPSDRVLLFTRVDCPACEAVLNTLLARIDAFDGIDIYLTDVTTGDDAAVRSWAAGQAIDPGLVHSRRVTLNHDAGALKKLTEGAGEVPYVMRRRGGALSRLLPSAL